MAELDLTNVMLGTPQPDVLGEFYAKVFGREPDMHDQDWYGWQVGSGYLSVGPHSEVQGQAKEPQRVIINLTTSEVKEEFDRISGTGATVVKQPYELEGMWIATFADPDGNYFQLMSPFEQPAEGEPST